MKVQSRSLLIVLILLIILIGAWFWFYQKNTSSDGLNDNISLRKRLEICQSIPHGTTREVVETSRVFINLPEDIYPHENRKFTFNGATAGIIQGGEGLYINDEFVKNKCATHYYEFNGNGTVDLRVGSVTSGIPPYEIHFRVKGESDL